MFQNLMHEFRWGNIDDPDVYLDENNRRMLTNFRYTFASLAGALIGENKIDSARQVLDKGMELMSNRVYPIITLSFPLSSFIMK